jgi:hypothetical protein
VFDNKCTEPNLNSNALIGMMMSEDCSDYTAWGHYYAIKDKKPPQ